MFPQIRINFGYVKFFALPNRSRMVQEVAHHGLFLPAGVQRGIMLIPASIPQRSRTSGTVEKTRPERTLRRRTFFFSDIRESPTLLREPLQQRRGFPNFTMLPVEFHDALVYLLEPNGVGVPHRPASIAGKAVTIYINDVDV